MLGNTIDTKNLRNTEYMKRWFDQVGYEAADEIERYEKIIGRVAKKCNEEMKWAQDNIDEINLPTPHEYQDGESHSYQEGDLADLLRHQKAYKEISALLEV